jgi:hypothetical protein
MGEGVGQVYALEFACEEIEKRKEKRKVTMGEGVGQVSW